MEYLALATDSAGTQFVLGKTDRAVKALAYLRSDLRQRLSLAKIVVHTADGEADEPTLQRLAEEEVHAQALAQAGRRLVPGAPPEN